MPNRHNKRILYSNSVIGLKSNGSTGDFTPVFGVQQTSMSTNFNLEQIFELGQLQVYEQLEALPDVEVSLNKVIDGKPLIWHLATVGQVVGPTLINRSNARCILGMGIYPDTNNSAQGTPPSIVECSGLYPQSLAYTFGIDGAFTEAVTFVGNDRIWNNDDRITNTTDLARSSALSFDAPSAFANNNDTPSGIEQRENLTYSFDGSLGLDVNNMVADPDATILPPEIDGISSSGTNEEYDEAYNARIQSISLNVNLGRESINELGRRGPYHRYAQFPVEVTCSIEAISTSGDRTSATEDGIYNTGGTCSTTSYNLKNRTIRVATECGNRFYLGTKNRLSSVDFGNLSTDGGNATNTYNFTTFNDLTVISQYDPNVSGANWWAGRANYLVNT